MSKRLTLVFRRAVYSYLTEIDEDIKLQAFNTLVTLCMTNIKKAMFVPSRSVGIGIKNGRHVKDNLIKDLAEEFILDTLSPYYSKGVMEIESCCDRGTFDFMGNRFKARFIDRIRKITASHEEDIVADFFEGGPMTPPTALESTTSIQNCQFDPFFKSRGDRSE